MTLYSFSLEKNIESGIPYSYKIIPYNLCGGSNAVTGVFFTGEERKLHTYESALLNLALILYST